MRPSDKALACKLAAIAALHQHSALDPSQLDVIQLLGPPRLGVTHNGGAIQIFPYMTQREAAIAELADFLAVQPETLLDPDSLT